MNKEFKLSDFLKLTQADGAIVLNAKGELIESENVKKAKNFAGMSSVMIKMAKEFSTEIGIGELKQYVFKAKEGVFILNNFEENFIVGIYSKEVAKTGLIMMSMDNLIKKIK